jgi:hypothetical protein
VDDPQCAAASRASVAAQATAHSADAGPVGADHNHVGEGGGLGALVHGGHPLSAYPCMLDGP